MTAAVTASTGRVLTAEERSRARNVGIAYLVLAAVCLIFFTRADGTATFGIGGGDTLGIPAAGLAWVASLCLAVLGGIQLARGLGRLTNVVLAAGAIGFVITFLAWAAAGKSFDFSGMLQDAVSRSVPLTFGAMAGVLCERSGVINIAIEGQLLAGAFVGTVVGSLTNQWVAVLAAGAVGALLGLLLAVLAIRFKVDQVIVGFAINFFVLGLTSFLDSRVLTKNPQYNQVAVLRPLKHPDPLQHPGHRRGAVRSDDLRLRLVRAGLHPQLGAVPHPLGPPDAGRRRAPRGRRHARRRRAAGAVPQRHPGRDGGRPGRGLVAGRVHRSLRREHHRRPRVHRAGRADLRPLEPGRSVHRGARLRPVRRRRRQAGHPEDADPDASSSR